MSPVAILDFNPAGYTDDRPVPLDHCNEDRIVVGLLSNAQKQATCFLSKRGWGGGGGGGHFLIDAHVHQHRSTQQLMDNSH